MRGFRFRRNCFLKRGASFRTVLRHEELRMLSVFCPRTLTPREVLFVFALPHLLFAICPPLLRISGVKLEELPAFLWEDDKQKTEKEVKAEEPKNA